MTTHQRTPMKANEHQRASMKLEEPNEHQGAFMKNKKENSKNMTGKGSNNQFRKSVNRNEAWHYSEKGATLHVLSWASR